MMGETAIRVRDQFVTLEFLLDAYYGVEAGAAHLGVPVSELLDAVERWAASPRGIQYGVCVDRARGTVSQG